MRMKNIIASAAIAGITLLASVSCSGGGRNASLDSAERMMNQYPDSALIILRSLDAAELDTDADRAKYSLLYSQALDKNHIDIKSDSLISYAVEYYDRVGDDANSAKAYYYLGCVYENADDFYAAARAYVEAKNYVHAVDDDYLRGLIYFRMGALYDWQCNIDEAIATYEQALDCFTRAGAERGMSWAYISLIRNYSTKNDLNNVIEYIGRGRALAEKQGDTTMLLDMTLCHANVLNAKLDTPRAALEMLYSDYRKYGIAEPPADHCFALGHMYLNMNKVDSARMFIERYPYKDVGLNRQLGWHYIMSKIAYADRNIDEFAYYFDTANSLRDSLFHINRMLYMQNLDCNSGLRRLDRAKNDLQSRYDVAIAVYSVILGIVLSLLALSVYLLYRRGRRVKSLGKVVADIEEHNDNLGRTNELLLHKNSLMRTVVDERAVTLKEILKIAGEYRDNPEKFAAEFKRYVKGDDRHGAIAVCRNLLETECAGILDYVSGRYPDLTDDDIDLYCLICAGCSVEVLCMIYDNTTKYMYNKRSVLRKKLMLSDEDCSIQSHFARMVEDFARNRITSCGAC